MPGNENKLNRARMVQFFIFIFCLSSARALAGDFAVRVTSRTAWGDRILHQDFYKGGKKVARLTFSARGQAPGVAGRVPDGEAREYPEGSPGDSQAYWAGTYIKGKLQGRATDYDQSHQVRWEAEYKDGILDGVSRDFDREGRLEQETHYKNGKEHGLQKIYDGNGMLTRLNRFVEGTLISSDDVPPPGSPEYTPEEEEDE